MNRTVPIAYKRWRQIVVAIAAIFMIVAVGMLMAGVLKHNSIADKAFMVFALIFGLGEIYWCLATGAFHSPRGGIADRKTSPETFWLIVSAFSGLVLFAAYALLGSVS